MNTLRYSIAFVLGIVLPLLVQRWDKGRRRPKRGGGGALGRLYRRVIAATIISEEQRSGLWNGASWGAALYAFGPLSMLGWVWVAHHDWKQWRRWGWIAAILLSIALLCVGALASLFVSALIVWTDALIAFAFGLPE